MERSSEENGPLKYAIEIDKEPLDYLCNLDISKAIRIKAKIEDTAKMPYHFYKRLVGRPDFRLRVGDYRIIADIFENEKLIRITKIGHRREIYKDI